MSTWTPGAISGLVGGFRAGLEFRLSEDELIGVLLIAREEPGPFTDEQVQLVQTFADQTAITIANARLTNAGRAAADGAFALRLAAGRGPPFQQAGGAALAGHRAYISCLFSDLRGFTAFAETAAPEELLELLREYHT